MRLYPFQEKGVEFLLSNPPELRGKNRKLLADGMGLGKTIQLIEAAKRLKAKSALIVTPASVKYNWKRKMIEWGWGCDESIHVVASSTDRIPDRATFVVVNYDLLRYDGIIRQLGRRKYRVGIFDESHRLKNAHSKRRKAILGAKKGLGKRCKAKWFATGTPVPNRPVEAWAILESQVPWLIHPFEKWVDFGMQFCNGRHCLEKEYGLRDPANPSEQYNFMGASNIRDLRKRLAPFMLRREIKDVWKQLPPLVEEVIYLAVDIHEHPDIQAQRDNPMVLRTEAYDPNQEFSLAAMRRIIAECKISQGYSYIEDCLQSVDKLLVFTYHRSVTETLIRLFEENKRKAVALYGGVSAVKKQKLIDKFIEDPTIEAFICQIVSGGEAVDGLQRVCNHVLFFEIDWSHGGMEQAKARLYRIGQNKTVYAAYLLAQDTLEMGMADSLNRKDYVINQLIRSEKPVEMSIEILLERIAVACEKIADRVSTPSNPVDVVDVVSEKTESKKKPDKKATKPAKPVVEDDDDDDDEAEDLDAELDDDDDEEEAKPVKAKSKDKKASKPKKVTLDDLQELSAKLLKHPDYDKDSIIKLIKKTGGEKKLSNVDESKYEKLRDVLQEALDSTPSDDDDDGDDD